MNAAQKMALEIRAELEAGFLRDIAGVDEQIDLLVERRTVLQQGLATFRQVVAERDREVADRADGLVIIDRRAAFHRRMAEYRAINQTRKENQ